MITFDKIRVSDKFQWRFSDISAEEYRIYHFNLWTSIKIEKPVALCVTEKVHRIICEDWTSKYVFLEDVLMIDFKVKDWYNHFDV